MTTAPPALPGQSLKQTLERKPRTRLPATWNGGHESGTIVTNGPGATPKPLEPEFVPESIAGSVARMNALAGPGVVADNEDEDRDRKQRMNEPTKRRCHNIEQDANTRP